MLETCFKSVYDAQAIVGGRFIMLECQNIEKIIEFYEGSGFKRLQWSENGKYLQMIKKL
jgi:hypothetical protein